MQEWENICGTVGNVQQATKLNCSNSSQLLERVKMKERSFTENTLFCSSLQIYIFIIVTIEEGRAASPDQKFKNLLSISLKGVSADIIQNLAVGNFSSNTKGTKTKAARC